MTNRVGNRKLSASIQAGFTLIEVMFALAIASMALLAVSSVVGGYARNLQGLQERTWAHWAAMNRIVEIRLQEEWPAVGKQSGVYKDAPYPVFWKSEVKKTPYESIRKMEIGIYRDKMDTEPVTTLTTYVGEGSGW